LEEKKRFSERVKEDISYTVKIPIKFPRRVYAEFYEFCEQESAGCFWLGIDLLLKEWKRGREIDSRTLVIIKRMQTLEERIARLEAELSEEKKEKPKRKHFGREEK